MKRDFCWSFSDFARKIGGTTVEAVMVTKDAMATIAAFVEEGGKGRYSKIYLILL